MSKEPEVGDVWVSQYGHKVHVDFTDNIVTSFYYRGLYRLCKKSVVTKEFIKAYTYLGKSKVNIEQLFEVCDELTL
jgi:hypothetical protein